MSLRSVFLAAAWAGAAVALLGCKGPEDAAEDTAPKVSQPAPETGADAGDSTAAELLPGDDAIVAATETKLDAAALPEYLPSSPTSELEDFTLPDDPGAPLPPENSKVYAAVAERRELDESVWKNEVLAQEHEQMFVWLWDRLLFEKNRFQALEEFPFTSLTLGELEVARELEHGIRAYRESAERRTIARANWPAALAEMQQAGYEIVGSEWHHQGFVPATDEALAHSEVNFSLYVTLPAEPARYLVKGILQVGWSDAVDDAGRPIPATIDVANLRVLERRGETAFEKAAEIALPIDYLGKTAPTSPHPLMVYDLDEDGRDELIVGGHNAVYRDLLGDSQRDNFIGPIGPQHANAGLIADLDCDGVRDCLMGLKSGPLVLYLADENGDFRSEHRRIVELNGRPLRLTVPSSLAAGDIDNDGDLDVFVAQLRPPYLLSKVPTPFYDANDGFPSYMLLNDGQGNFRDVTELVGLAPKRFRRTFSSSFVDLDDDNDLDLVVINDFSGVDVYFNNGAGGFEDRTDEVIDLRTANGMSHTFGDYNLDGRMDFYMIGMSSTTVRRLDYMGLRRDDEAEFARYSDMRTLMGYGNRMYLAGDGVFHQAPFNDQVARCGWAWGSTTLDFDNDGDSDVYVSNGQLSGKTTKDYCTRYWCHDIYLGDRQGDESVGELISQLSVSLGGAGISWNGYEHNPLFMNLDGTGFVNVGFLMGCDLVEDCRCVVSDDLDNDGRIDLIVEEKKPREPGAVIHVLRNRLPDAGQWIGFRLRDQGPGRSPIGVKATITLEDGTQRIGQYTVGHSVWAQHAPRIHFGLGDHAQVVAADFTWPNGATLHVENPGVGEYHEISAP